MKAINTVAVMLNMDSHSSLENLVFESEYEFFIKEK